MVMFAQINFRDVGPGFGQRAAQQLEADVKAGALGLGEIMKGFGLTARKADGSRLTLDDPGARSDLGDGRAAEDSGADSHRRSAGVLSAARLLRTSAGWRWRSIRIAGIRRRAIRRSRR